jgi:hypothetical protein
MDGGGNLSTVNTTATTACQQVESHTGGGTGHESESSSGIILFLGVAVGIGGK